MLGIRVNVNIVDDETTGEFENIATGKSVQMQRICHPEHSKSGVCPECAVHWFRVFDPETMEGIDGEGKLPEVGWHEFCVCEDIVYTEKQGFEARKFGEELINRYGKTDDISSLGKTKDILYNEGALGIKDVLQYKKQTGEYNVRKLREITNVLKYTKKSDLQALATKLGYSANKIKDLRNKDLINIILQKKIQSKTVTQTAKETRISILKLGGK